jgi:hypothetical protein
MFGSGDGTVVGFDGAGDTCLRSGLYGTAGAGFDGTAGAGFDGTAGRVV